jgi:hypothetical protein
LAGFLIICFDKSISALTSRRAWIQPHARVGISLNNTVAIPDQFENTYFDKLCILLIKYMPLYVFMKLTTRSTNVAFIGYYEFYSRLQTTVQFSLHCDIFL